MGGGTDKHTAGNGTGGDDDAESEAEALADTVGVGGCTGAERHTVGEGRLRRFFRLVLLSSVVSSVVSSPHPTARTTTADARHSRRRAKMISRAERAGTSLTSSESDMGEV